MKDVFNSAKESLIFFLGVSFISIFLSLFIVSSVQDRRIKQAYKEFKDEVLGLNTQVLQAQTEGKNEINFIYDSSGQRIAKLDENGDNVYYLSPNLEVIVSSEGEIKWRKNYFFGGRFVAVREGP